MTWGSLLVLLGFLDSKSQESPIGIGTGHRLATDLSKFVQIKGGRKVSRVQVDDTSLKDKEYLGFEVLEGEVGNSFYGSRLGCSFRCSVEVRFYGFSTVTTTATSTATTTTSATAERLFEALRVYEPSTTTTTATSKATTTTSAR